MRDALQIAFDRFFIGWVILLPAIVIWPEFWNPVGSYAWPAIVGAAVIAIVWSVALIIFRVALRVLGRTVEFSVLPGLERRGR
jgi:hypothetical protein